ncbi:MAG TPA: hypothetical protein VF533_05270, partial [Solirubrobacteraceae bacterium]
ELDTNRDSIQSDVENLAGGTAGDEMIGGRVQLVGSNAWGRRHRDAVSRLRVGGRTKRRGLTIRRAGRVAFVSVARGGRIRAVAVTSRRFSRRPRAFVSSDATAASLGRLTGRSLAGSGNSQLDAALVMLCQLQLSGGDPR